MAKGNVQDGKDKDVQDGKPENVQDVQDKDVQDKDVQDKDVQDSVQTKTPSAKVSQE